jgi:hypothetical protein
MPSVGQQLRFLDGGSPDRTAMMPVPFPSERKHRYAGKVIRSAHAPALRWRGVLQGELFREDLQKRLGVADRKYFRSSFLRPALEAGLIQMTNPDMPRSSRQRYRLTERGRRMLIGNARGRNR